MPFSQSVLLMLFYFEDAQQFSPCYQNFRIFLDPGWSQSFFWLQACATTTRPLPTGPRPPSWLGPVVNMAAQTLPLPTCSTHLEAQYLTTSLSLSFPAMLDDVHHPTKWQTALRDLYLPLIETTPERPHSAGEASTRRHFSLSLL